MTFMRSYYRYLLGLLSCSLGLGMFVLRYTQKPEEQSDEKDFSQLVDESSDLNSLFVPSLGSTDGGFYQQLKNVLGFKFGSLYPRIIHTKTTNAATLIKSGKYVVKVHGRITGSFYKTALKHGIPHKVITEASHLLRHEVNWNHAFKSGDKFAIFYEVHKNTKGQITKVGKIHYVAFAPKGSLKEIYYFEPKSGKSGFYNANGEQAVKNQTAFRVPLNTKYKITSHFGYRQHPLENCTKFHKGVDYSVPYGTPIVAAASGTVAKAGWNGGYGKYIAIKHTSGYQTAYAHLSQINVKPGQKVTQGQLIGRVGQTGTASGPHLHLELHYNNNHINPMKIKSIPSDKLSGQDLKRFTVLRQKMKKEFWPQGV